MFWQKETKLEKPSIKHFAHKTHQSVEEVRYEAEFEVPESFGEIGAILVENEHHREMFVKEIVLDGFILGPVRFACESWLHSKHENPDKRIFFPNKVSSITTSTISTLSYNYYISILGFFLPVIFIR